MVESSIEGRLKTLITEVQETDSLGEAIAAIATASALINEAWERLGSKAVEEGLGSWLDYLIEAADRAAESFDLGGYTVSIGSPTGVSVSLAPGRLPEEG